MDTTNTANIQVCLIHNFASPVKHSHNNYKDEKAHRNNIDFDGVHKTVFNVSTFSTFSCYWLDSGKTLFLVTFANPDFASRKININDVIPYNLYRTNLDKLAPAVKVHEISTNFLIWII